MTSPKLNLELLAKNIDSSPTPYHAVSTISNTLIENSFVKLDLRSIFTAEPGKYFVSVGGSIIAWIQNEKFLPYRIVGSHSDSPNLRVRPNADLNTSIANQLTVEIYGSPLLNSWLDRDLGLAGLVNIKDSSGKSEHLLTLDKSVLRIPQLAIHLDRKLSSDGLKLDQQKHLKPMWLTGPDKPVLNELIADQLSISSDQILSSDMMLYDLQNAEVISGDSGFLSSSRIDNLLSVFAGLDSLSQLSDDCSSTPVFAVFDNEEVGSRSDTGAAGAFLDQVLERISLSNSLDRGQYLAAISNSHFLSVDGAHATHPNYPEKHDPNHRIIMNNGIVIKHNTDQHYATDARSESDFISCIDGLDLEIQRYSHRNDMSCGTTIGPIVSANLAINSIDIGVAQLAMHSIRETAGCKDILDLGKAISAFWSN